MIYYLILIFLSPGILEVFSKVFFCALFSFTSLCHEGIIGLTSTEVLFHTQESEMSFYSADLSVNKSNLQFKRKR